MAFMREYIKYKKEIKNIIKTESVELFLSSDNNYAPFWVTTIVSILENTKSFVNIYVLDSNITKKNKKKIYQTLKKYDNYNIEYLEIDDKYFADLPVCCHFTRAMYNRFLIPILKPNIKRALYSDVDVVFLGDISEFYNINLDGYGIAAPTMEISKVGSYCDNSYLGISRAHQCFQSGNLLIDCEYWRKHDITKKLIDCVYSKKDILSYPDAEALNIIFDNNYKILDYRYSVCTHVFDYENKKDEIREQEKNPFLIHYAGAKPWNCDNIPYSDLFWKTAKKTCFYNELLHKKYKKTKKSLLEMVFSVRNNENKTHKVITFLGIKIKLKRRKHVSTNCIVLL